MPLMTEFDYGGEIRIIRTSNHFLDIYTDLNVEINIVANEHQNGFTRNLF